MKKVLLIGLSVLLLGVFFMMLRTVKETGIDLRLKRGGSFIEGVKIIQKKDGVTAWTLTASTADFLEGDEKAELKDIALVLPNNNVILHADRGIYNMSQQSFTTHSIVRADGEDFRITANTLDYETVSGKVKTGGRVKVESKGFQVEGTGMEADSEQKVSIFKDVKATFNKVNK